MSFGPLHYVAADFLIDQTGSLRLIELNSLPGDLTVLAREAVRSSEAKSENPLSIYARALSELCKKNKRNIIILSERFEFDLIQDVRPTQIVLRKGDDHPVTESAKSVIRLLNALRTELRVLGHNIAFADARFLDSLSKEGTRNFNVVDARSSDLSHWLIPDSVRQTHSFCRDKLLLAQLFPADCHRWMIATCDASADYEEVSEFCSRFEYLIVKPRFGYGSLGVERYRAEDLCSLLQSGGLHAMTGSKERLKSYVIQEWVRPSELPGRESRLFDLRLHLVSGKIVVGYVRTACGKNTEALSSSPLSWLTTLGDMEYIYSNPELESFVNRICPNFEGEAEGILVEVRSRLAQRRQKVEPGTASERFAGLTKRKTPLSYA